jgi:hypothetical protein
MFSGISAESKAEREYLISTHRSGLKRPRQTEADRVGAEKSELQSKSSRQRINAYFLASFRDITGESGPVWLGMLVINA